MSMVCTLVAVSPQQLDAFIGDPDLVMSFLHPEEGDDVVEDGKQAYLDKAWHAIHYLLNGSAWEGEGPLSLVIMGGEEIGEDMGYGPARYLLPAQVKEVSAALADIDAEAFGQRFDPAAMDAAEIYPEIWVRNGEEELEYLQHDYARLRAFYHAAAGRADAVLIQLS